MDKPIYKSKAMWGGFLVIFGGLLTALGQLFSGNLDFGTFLTQITPMLGTGLGIIGLRTAQK